MKNLIKILVIIIFTIFIALISIYSERRFSNQLQAEENSVNTDNNTIELDKSTGNVMQNEGNEVYAILRPDKNGNWYILDDSGHTPSGNHYIEQNENYIILYFADTFNDIHWSSITPDETLVVNGIDVGASVGLGSARIYLAKNGDIINPSTITQPGANIWVYIKGE